MNGAMSGGLSAVVLCGILYHRRKYILDIPYLASGILGGLVAVTAGAPVLRPWEGLFIGFIGGMIANGGISSIIFLSINVVCYSINIVFVACILEIYKCLCYSVANELVAKLKIDDPVGAFGVHYASGLWAMIATGLFAEKIQGFDVISEDGCFKGGNGGILGWNLVACIVITLWSGGLTAIVVCTVIT